MTEYGTIWADQNQKNGDISVPDGQNFYRILRPKIRLKKLAKKKFSLTPTQKFVILDF